MDKDVLTEQDIIDEVDWIIDGKLGAKKMHYCAWAYLIKDLIAKRNILMSNLYENMTRKDFERLVNVLGFEYNRK